VSDVSDVPFAIEAPRITVTAPNGGENWLFGTTHGITWTHNLGTGESVSIDLSRDGGSTWESIASSVTNTGATTGQFSWLVTSPVTSRALVRVSWLHRPQGFVGFLSDRSDAPFTIASHIRVTTPNVAVTWAAGSERIVSWSHDYGASALFDVDVSTDGGQTWIAGLQNVAANSATTGSREMPMPGIVTSQALVRVSPAGRPGDGDVSDVPFALVAPTLGVSVPAAGAVWTIGTSHNVEWGTNVGLFDFGYSEAVSYDSGATWHSISLSGITSAGAGPHGAWFVSGPATTHARIRMTWTGNGLSVSAESPDFTIASRITVTTPNTAVTWLNGSFHTITWTHNYGAQQTFDVTLSPDAGATWILLAAGVPASDATNGNFGWTINALPTTQALIRVSPSNNFGNGDSSDTTFTIAQRAGG
jgi:hypothetical protein